MKIRIHELAKELGVEKETMMALLKERRMIPADVRSVSSPVDSISDAALRTEFANKLRASPKESPDRDRMNELVEILVEGSRLSPALNFRYNFLAEQLAELRKAALGADPFEPMRTQKAVRMRAKGQPCDRRFVSDPWTGRRKLRRTMDVGRPYYSEPN